MSTDTITPEVVSEEQAAPEEREMQLVVQQNGLQPETAQSIQTSFGKLFSGARDILKRSAGIIVTDASQKFEMKLARECRLALRAIRVEGEKVKKALKDESLRKGRAIDGFYNILVHITEEEEKRLDEQEKFVERQEAARKEALKAEREQALQQYGVDTTFFQLGEMGDAAYAQLFENSKAAFEHKQEAARKAEEERIRIENERLKEEQRIREENARLKREAEMREAEAKAEYERQQKEAAERAERERAELQRRYGVHQARLNAVRPYLAVTEVVAPLSFADLSDDQFAKVLAGRKGQAEERERLAKEKREAEERAQKEREYAEKQLAAEREAKALAEKALWEAQENEKRRKAAEEAERRRAAKAPDKQKLAMLANAIRALTPPELKSVEGIAFCAEFEAQRDKFAGWVATRAATL